MTALLELLFMLQILQLSWWLVTSNFDKVEKVSVLCNYYLNLVTFYSEFHSCIKWKHCSVYAVVVCVTL